MEFFNSELKSDFDRVIAQIPEDPFTSPSTLGIFDVLRAHYLIADFFVSEQRELGGIGPKDLNLLQSALYRPWVEFGGVAKWATPIEKAATTLFGLIKDHPFTTQISEQRFFQFCFCWQNRGACLNARKTISRT